MTKITEMHSNTKDYVKKFSKTMLKTQLFVGTFQERRYVEPLTSYRDVIKVDSTEKKFIENILAVRKKLKQELVKDPAWIGITGPDTIGAPVGYTLWVILPTEVFGTYWFKVKTVEFLENEVRLKLAVIRPMRNEKSASDILEAEDSQNFDLRTTVQDLSNSVRSNIINGVKNYVTLTNIKDTVIFLCVLIGTIVAGVVNLIKYLMDFFLKFMKETTGFVKVCTPIVISCIELIRKTIYGLFALIVTLVYGKPIPPQPVYIPYGYTNGIPQYGEHYNGYQYNRRRALQYRSPRSTVTIEPVDDDY